jgi:hypothetical protein
LGRPFIEFIHSQFLPWTIGFFPEPREALRVKILSRDDMTGAATLIVEYPAEFVSGQASAMNVDEEIFVLNGGLEVGGVSFGPHDYGFWGAGRPLPALKATDRTLALAFISGAPKALDADGAKAIYRAGRTIEHLGTIALPWDQSNMDPNIGHLHAWRKNLRLDPDGAARTYLLAGLPHGYPADGRQPLERHPHIEEMFMVSGDMPCSKGIMRAGAYFWRPENIWHGADCTLNGFLLLGRTPGSNKTISEWDETTHPVTYTPDHRPHIPAELKPYDRPASDPVTY